MATAVSDSNPPEFAVARHSSASRSRYRQVSVAFGLDGRTEFDHFLAGIRVGIHQFTHRPGHFAVKFYGLQILLSFASFTSFGLFIETASSLPVQPIITDRATMLRVWMIRRCLFIGFHALE